MALFVYDETKAQPRFDLFRSFVSQLRFGLSTGQVTLSSEYGKRRIRSPLPDSCPSERLRPLGSAEYHLREARFEGQRVRLPLDARLPYQRAVR